MQPIKWDYVVDFYNFDAAGAIRMAPKLTDDHISLPMFTKMRVNLAAQVLSHTVAAGISTLHRLKYISEEAKTTATFIETMDQLFNAFNSSGLTSRQKFGHALTNTSGHFEFLKDTLEYFNNLELPNKRSLPCINGWKISISSLLGLWTDLSQKLDFKFLLTNRLNQDCVENLFSIIRGKGGKRDNPDAREFRSSYRQVLFDQLLIPSEGSNCQVDSDDILLSLTNITASSTEPPRAAPSAALQPLAAIMSGVEMLPVMRPPVSVPTQNIEAYMAGYLLCKSNIADCQTCKVQLMYDIPPDNDIYIFLKEKAYVEQNTLFYPTETFVELVEKWETVFTGIFQSILHMTGILWRLCKNADDFCNNFLTCKENNCAVKLYAMLRLYMKVRLHSSLKRSNKANKVPGAKRNSKMLKLSHV